MSDKDFSPQVLYQQKCDTTPENIYDIISEFTYSYQPFYDSNLIGEKIQDLVFIDENQFYTATKVYKIKIGLNAIGHVRLTP